MKTNAASVDNSQRIQSITEQAERYLGKCILAQTWDLYRDDVDSVWPTSSLSGTGSWAESGALSLPKMPLLGVLGVYATNDYGVETAVDPASYWVTASGEPGRIALASGSSWPTHRGFEGIRIRVVAGYATPFQVQDDGTLIAPNSGLVSGQTYRVTRGLNNQVPDGFQEFTDYTVTNVVGNQFQLLDPDNNLVTPTQASGSWSFLGEVPEAILREIAFASLFDEDQAKMQGGKGAASTSSRRQPATISEDGMERIARFRYIHV